MMNQLIRWIGDAAAVAGIVLCAVAGVFRLAGSYYALGGIEVVTLFLLGVGLMVFACLSKLHLLAAR
jgi:hypothetical protein